MIKDIIYYTLKKSWKPLPNARLTKLVYLSDWKSALENQKQLSDIQWFFDYYGPFVKDIEACIDSNNEIFTKTTEFYWNWKTTKFSVNKDYKPKISEKEKNIIDFVIKKTQLMWFNDFIWYVYSTYPIYNSRKFTKLDLISLAKEYKKIP